MAGLIDQSKIWPWFSIGLGLVYVCAFLSFAAQFDGLYGTNGLQPLGDYLTQAESVLGAGYWWRLPTLFWIDTSKTMMIVLVTLGCGFSLLYAAGFMPMFSALISWICYLSMVNAGGRFMSFQWDILLLEAGFIGIWLFGAELKRSLPNYWSVLLLWWLYFRLMFSSGMVKLLSGDNSWRDWSAMLVHFETTPLPNLMGYYMHQMPEAMLRSLTGLTFFVELLVPFGIFFGTYGRRFSGTVTIVFMAAVAATGNYTFFNLLTAVICVSLFAKLHHQNDKKPNVVSTTIFVICGLLFLLSWVPFSRVLSIKPPAAIEKMHSLSSRFFLVNGYGLFANMTDDRPELIFESSMDGSTWLENHMYWKPGSPDQPPKQIAPYQPRVDWQLWFAALGAPQRNQWIFTLAMKLCDPQSPVTNTFFMQPLIRPRMIRIRRYQYRFTKFEKYRQNGNYWRRGLPQAYGPTLQCPRP